MKIFAVVLVGAILLWPIWHGGNGENYVVGNNFDKSIDCVVGGSQSAVANLASQSDMAGGGVNYL